MITLRRLIALAALAASSVATAQEPGAAARAVFHRAWFISAQTASMSGVPVSYDRGNANGIGTVPSKAAGSGMAFGAGVSGLFGNNRLLLQLAYDQAETKLTDWRVKDRPVSFSSVDMTIGVATHGPVALVPYFSFAPGWYRQTGYKEFDFNAPFGADSSGYEALERFDYNVGFALGIKAGFAKYFALNAESRWYTEDTGGSACGGNPNCIDLTDRPPAKRYGRRTSVGLQVYMHW